MADTMTSAGLTTSAVIEAIREQVGLFDRLRLLAVRQGELVRQQDTRQLMKVLTDRQALTESLNRNARRLAPFRRDWKRIRERMAPNEAAQIDELLKRADGMLRSIMEQDSEDVRMMKVRRETMAQEIRDTDSGARAVTAYRVPRLDTKRSWEEA